MNGIPTSMVVDDHLRAEFERATDEVKKYFTYLEAGQAQVLTGVPPRALGPRSVIIFTFVPGWKSWDEPGARGLDPCVLALGTDTNPGGVLRIGIRRDKGALTLTSSKTTSPAVLEGDFSGGGMLSLFFEDGIVSAYLKNKFDDQEVAFEVGDAGNAPLRLTLGAGDAHGSLAPAAPFVGALGSVLLFDQLVPLDVLGRSKLVRAFLKQRRDDLHHLLAEEGEKAVAAALAGVAWSGEKRFEANPRTLIWPNPDADVRWALRDSGTRPVQLHIEGVARDDHGIYSTMGLYSLVRRAGSLFLAGDRGQQFALSYLGDGRFLGRSAGTNALGETNHDAEAEFIFEPGTDITPERFRVESHGWSNADKKLFPKVFLPKGATLGANVTAADIWPERLYIERVAQTYDLAVSGREHVDQVQSFKDAFSERLPQIGAISQGWDISGFDDPIAITNSTGAARAELDYLFAQPDNDSKHFRFESEIAAPYYCFSFSSPSEVSKSSSRLYETLDSFTDEEGSNFGLDLGMGEQKLFGLSFSKTQEWSGEVGTSCSIALGTASTIRHVVMLDRRWLTLAKPFHDRVLEAAQAVLDGDLSDVGNIFERFGTHYANAITYGSKSYKVGFIDSQTMARGMQEGEDISLKLGIPVEGAVIGVNGGQQQQHGSGGKQSVESDISVERTVGIATDPIPVLLDLRPITELLTEPYFRDPRIGQARWGFEYVWKNYLASRRPPGDSTTYAVYQARLKKIENNDGSEPVYLTARGFLGGVAKSAVDWTTCVPEKTERTHDPQYRIWSTGKRDMKSSGTKGEGTIRIEPNGTYTPPPLPPASVAIAHGDGSVQPAIGFTGLATWVDEPAISNRLEGSPWRGGKYHTGHNPPSAQQLQAAESDYASFDNFPFTGFDWVAGANPEFYMDEASEFLIREHRKIDPATLGPAFSEVKVKVRKLTALFEVRRVDVVDYFNNPSKYQV